MEKVGNVGREVLRVKLKPKEKTSFELSFEGAGSKGKQKFADDQIFQNKPATRTMRENLALTEWLFKAGNVKAGFQKEAFGAPGWAPVTDDGQAKEWTMAKLAIPAEWKNFKIMLHYEAKSSLNKQFGPAKVYLNGMECKRGLNPACKKGTMWVSPATIEHIYDLTKAVKFGADNTLVVHGNPPGFRNKRVGLQLRVGK